ncbi:MAG: phage major capsid protein [Desulfobacteraceae bacterium]|nr:phage major capsid protein [Desulfobacteraceae bacterium]
MKTISQYREDIKNLKKKGDDIEAKATLENRDLSDSELALLNEIGDATDDLMKTVATLERRDRTAKILEAPDGAVTVPSNKKMDIRPVEKDRFSSLGQQIMAIKNAGMPGGHVDPRLFNVASGLNETVPSEGAFLVQSDFTAELLQDVIATGILAPKCRRVTISGNANSTKINGIDETSRASSRYGGIISYWEGEADKFTGTKPKFRQIELSLKKLTGLCYATDENLQDASQLEGIIRESFNGEFGFQIDDGIINGTGAGQFLGILNAGSLVSVDKEVGQKAKTIVAENVIKMSSRIFASSYQNAAWYVNQNTLPQLYTMSIAVGTGGQLVFVPPGGLSSAPYGSLLGRPVIPIEQCATLGTVGDIILADLSKGYVLAEKGGLESAVSIHVRFEYAESVFRFILRMDGQPVRASALTPYKGSETLGHFVALATRA